MDEKEAALLKKRLCELDNRSRQGGFALYSDFLDLYGQDIFWSLKLRDAHLLGGYDGAERKVACFCGDSPPLCFVKIAPKNKKFAAAMSHRDILGSLMGLGLRRETLGDIIVGEKDGTVYIWDPVYAMDSPLMAPSWPTWRSTWSRVSRAAPSAPMSSG